MGFGGGGGVPILFESFCVPTPLEGVMHSRRCFRGLGEVPSTKPNLSKPKGGKENQEEVRQNQTSHPPPTTIATPTKQNTNNSNDDNTTTTMT